MKVAKAFAGVPIDDVEDLPRLRLSTGERGDVEAVKEDSAEIRFSKHGLVCVPSDNFENLTVMEKPKTNKPRLILVLLLLCFFIYGIVCSNSISQLLDRFVEWCRTLGMLAPVLILIVSTVLPVIMLPVFPVMALSGPLFTKMYDRNANIGGAVAFAAVFSGLWLGSVVAFCLGKTIFSDLALRVSGENVYIKKLNRIIDHGDGFGGMKIVFMARSLPILPAEIFDYACSLTSLKIWQYAIGCLGSAVPVAFWTWTSAHATVAAASTSSEEKKRQMCLMAINVILLVVLTLVIFFTIRKQERETLLEDNDDAVTVRKLAGDAIQRFSSTSIGSRGQE